jgi:DNA-binding NarL/FixJ family response regulator
MGVRILIADDHEAARAAIAEMIDACDEDWSVCSEADDGRSAVKLAVEHRPDVVVLDVRMPKMDGMEAAHEIRRRLPGTPIVFYTLLATPRLEAAAHAAGFEAVVAKPDTLGLVAAIRRAVRSTRPGNAGSAENPQPI